MSAPNGNARKRIKSLDAESLPPLPKQWCWVTLDDLAAQEPHSITDGPFGSNLKTSHYTTTGPRVIRLQNIGDGVFVDEYAHISQQHFEKLKRHEIVAGDLAIAALGETLPKSCVIPHWVGPAIVKADCPRLRPNHEVVVSEYVNFALNSPDTRKRASAIIHGVGRPRLNLAEIRGVWLPLAPLNEQHRIVAKIEELFSDLDAGVAALERAKANVKRYRAAVLKAAVEGKLTEAWRAEHPGTEPASKLLECILTERRKKWEADQLARFTASGKELPKNWKEKYVEPVQPDDSSQIDIPEGWCVASLDQLTTTITSGSRDWSQFYGRGTGTFIMAQNVRPGRFDLSFRQPVDPPRDDRDRLRSQVKLGDLLVTIVGANTGDVCRIPANLPEHYVCQSVALARPADIRISRFAEIYFVAEHGGQSHFERYIYGQGRPHLGFDQLRMAPVVLPPLTEQDQIVSALEESLSQAAAAEKELETGLFRASRLRQSILKQAFEGKLVPQDPNDEPASMLLERLRASHESNGKTIKGKAKE